jgi:hypothetical protein
MEREEFVSSAVQAAFRKQINELKERDAFRMPAWAGFVWGKSRVHAVMRNQPDRRVLHEGRVGRFPGCFAHLPIFIFNRTPW